MVKAFFIHYFAVLLLGFIENNDAGYQSTNQLKSRHASRLEVEEHHRKYIYCTQACNGHSLRATCSYGKELLKRGNDNIHCLCPRSTKGIENSDCWTESHQPKAANLQEQFYLCGSNCRMLQVMTANIFPALCTTVKPKPAIINKGYDCFCVPFKEMPSPLHQLK